VDEPACDLIGCDGARSCELPADPAARGPWPVGARTVDLDGLTVEVWYPAQFGSERGFDPAIYDVRLVLPEAEQAKIPDGDNPWQACDCYRELPIDDRRGPYPVVIFIHGTAGYRMQSLTHLVHWASRGFVVLAADHPGLYLADMLQLIMDADLEGDLRSVISALGQPAGPLGFLAGRVDADRVALSGHSAGGMAAGRLGALPGVRVVIPMAAGGVEPAGQLEASVILGGIDDQVVPFDEQRAGYKDSNPPKLLAGVSNAGHLVFTDMCALTNAAGQDVVTIAVEHQVTNASLAELLFDGCDPGQIEPADGWQVVNAVTSAVLEHCLQCSDRSAELAGMPDRFALLGEYRLEGLP
jgi:predicted dienelactone hydrolase